MKNMTIKAVLFDCDGVVADTMNDHAKAWVLAFCDHGIDIKKEWVFEYEGAPSRDVAYAFYNRCGIKDRNEQAEELALLKDRYFDTLHKPRVYDGILPVLDLMAKRGVAIGLVTGASRLALARTLSVPLMQRFQTIVAADDVIRGKPDPEPYLKGAQRLGVDPSSCIVIENAIFGIRAAKAAGMFCIALATTLQHSSLSAADVIVEDHLALNKMLDEATFLVGGR